MLNSINAASEVWETAHHRPLISSRYVKSVLFRVAGSGLYTVEIWSSILLYLL